MQNYLVIALLGHGDEYYKDVNSFLVTLLHDESTRVIVVGDAEDYLDSIYRTGEPACVTSLVATFAEVKREVEDEEQVIGFNCRGRNIFDTAYDICGSFNCIALLSLGSDRGEVERHFETDNVILKLQITGKGKKVFCCPAIHDYTYEVLVDQIIRVESLTTSSFFEHRKPMAFLTNIFGKELSESIIDIAGPTGINLVATDAADAERDLDDYRCFLSANGLPEDTNVTIYYGLEFEYACILHDYEKSYHNILNFADFERVGEW